MRANLANEDPGSRDSVGRREYAIRAGGVAAKVA